MYREPRLRSGTQLVIAGHGKAGFDVFTHFKPILDKPTRPDPALMYPPYTSTKQKLIKKFL